MLRIFFYFLLTIVSNAVIIGSLQARIVDPSPSFMSDARPSAKRSLPTSKFQHRPSTTKKFKVQRGHRNGYNLELIVSCLDNRDEVQATGIVTFLYMDKLYCSTREKCFGHLASAAKNMCNVTPGKSVKSMSNAR